MQELDHLLLGVPDLSMAGVEFERRSGVAPGIGGSHPGLGTRNMLAALGARTYLEIIGPDPEQPPPKQGRPFGLDAITAPRLIAWAIPTTDIENRVERSRQQGYDPGDVHAMQRLKPDGTVLSWKLTVWKGWTPPLGGLIPFLIDWGHSDHPARTAPTGCRLVFLRGEHPDPAAVRKFLDALQVDFAVEPGTTARLVAGLETPAGELRLV